MKSSANIVWLKPDSTLDQVFLHDLVEGKVWKTLNWFPLEETTIDKTKGAVVVVPGQFWKVEQINEMIKPLKWVLLVVVCDEENLFEIDKLSHPNMKRRAQTPRAGKDYNATLFGVGYAFAARHRELKKKTNDVFLSAQDTHERRHSMFDMLSRYVQMRSADGVSGVLNRTKGFTQGFSEKVYYDYMNMSKIAPAPSGTCSPDSFRLYEALEMGAIPVADDISPRYDSAGYWRSIFPDAPFPIVGREEITPILDDLREDFQHKANNVFAWWIRQKKKYVEKFYSDIDELMGRTREVAPDEVTAIVTVSPWRDNPDTVIFEECIESIRDTLGDIDIIVTFDGVREEQAYMRAKYEEFVHRALYLCNKDGAILPIVFDKHVHQVGAVREALKEVQTNLILFVEGDTALRVRTEEVFEILPRIGKEYDLIRFYHFDEIPSEHQYLMRKRTEIPGGSLVNTIQWSQRPHLSTKRFYDKIMGYFSDNANCFIEDKMHGVAQTPKFDGKMAIYLSDGGATSIHLDGRKGLEKYDERQVF